MNALRLKVEYDQRDTVAEMIRWLAQEDPEELRDLALNLLDDVETLKTRLGHHDGLPRQRLT